MPTAPHSTCKINLQPANPSPWLTNALRQLRPAPPSRQHANVSSTILSTGSGRRDHARCVVSEALSRDESCEALIARDIRAFDQEHVVSANMTVTGRRGRKRESLRAADEHGEAPPVGGRY
jgi:hypothetical protein